MPSKTTGAASAWSATARPQVDPSLLRWSQDDHSRASAAEAGPSLPRDPAVDPTLDDMQRVVEDVRKGRMKPKKDAATPSAALAGPSAETTGALESTTVDMSAQAWPAPTLADSDPVVLSSVMGNPHLEHGMDEFDPALREIVNSLTNAQQIASGSNTGGGMTPAEAVAALGAHIHEADERDRLSHTLQSTLDDISLQALLHQSGHFDPSASYILGPSTSTEDPTAGPSILADLATDPAGPAPPPKRGPGRPKGSKNKPKPAAVLEAEAARKRKPTPPPPRPKGRPPKPRTPEEQAEYDKRKAERAQGIKRQRGRPRKFPGYLVRDMRLRKNRKEWEWVKRQGQMEATGDLVEATRDGGGGNEGEDVKQDLDTSNRDAAEEYWDLPEGERMLMDTEQAFSAE